MSRTDRATRTVSAPLAKVYGALVEKDSMGSWLAPRGMSARFDSFDPRPGGTFRLVLSYADESSSNGKTTPDTDVVQGRFVEIVPDSRVVYVVEFVASGPRFEGEMTMTWELTEAPGGTRVDILAENVPDAISRADHAAGLTSSLDNLARFLES